MWFIILLMWLGVCLILLWKKGQFEYVSGVEVMIIIAIIGLLAAIAIPNFIRAKNDAQGIKIEQKK